MNSNIFLYAYIISAVILINNFPIGLEMHIYYKELRSNKLGKISVMLENLN